MNIFSFFEVSFRKNPKANALYVDNKHYSYEELFFKSKNISAQLSGRKNHFIGLFANKSICAFSGVLGILHSGNAYVPLNPKFPSERIARVILESKINTIIVETSNLEKLEKIEATIKKSLNVICLNSDAEITSKKGYTRDNINTIQTSKQVNFNQQNNYAYMLFTSGSTGNPKGVPITHKNVGCYIENINKFNSFESSDRFTNTFDLTFDLSVHDMFVCWSNGGELYSIPDNAIMAPAKFIKKNEITCWFSVPTLAYSMNKLRMLKEGSFPKLKYSFFCGEPLHDSLAERWQLAAPNSILKNIYGPTEATIGITSFTFNLSSRKMHNGILSIGRIFPGNSFHIDEKSGELLLSGCQVANMYWNNDIKSSEAFVEYEGNIWYKTGDIVRKDKEGDLFFIGRIDNQVQIRGFRVEPEEVDFVISKLLRNSNVFTFAQEFKNSTILITCINDSSKDSDNQAKEIMNYCKEMLPDYMVPSEILFFKDFPLNASGKIDRVKMTQRATELINKNHQEK